MAAEMIALRSGLGYMIMDSRNAGNRYDLVIAGMIIIGLIGLLLDGATRLLATAYIGIGNKLFIRGDGPGLSWDKGVPMQFVSIGKWGWATHDAAGPVACKLYKNDETAALSGEIFLEPGKHVEITTDDGRKHLVSRDDRVVTLL